MAEQAQQPQAQAAPPQGQQGPANDNNPILLNLPELRLQFGRLNSRRARVNLTVNPGLLTRVYTAEYHAAVSCLAGMIIPEINVDDYVRISRTFLLKRLQDVVEYQSGIRPPGALQLARGFDVLRPSAELLYALGPYFCDLDGKQYNLAIHPAGAVPENWRAIDNAILQNYRLLIDQVRNRYTLAPFPKMSEMQGHPLHFTVGQEEEQHKTVRSINNLPQPSDAFLRFVHEEFYVNNIPAYNDCSLVMTENLLIDDVVNRYVRSYVNEVRM